MPATPDTPAVSEGQPAGNPYSETAADAVSSATRIHANSEQTHVTILEAGEAYVAVAYDIDPVEFQPGAAEVVAYGPTREGVETRVRRWQATHARGVAGSNDDSGGGVLSKVWGLLQRVDEHGQQAAPAAGAGDGEENGGGHA